MPEREQKPEINQLYDPKVPEIPMENPQVFPNELPPENNR